MSNSGVNTGFAKCFILFIAILTLVQGGVYLGLAIWGLDLSECDNKSSDISANPFKYAIDLIYFSNQECGDISVSLPNKVPEIGPIDTEIALKMDWAKAEEITDRTKIFLITYAVVMGLWVLTSLLVIVTICITTTNLITGLFYWPWFLVIFAGSILDAVATGFHIKDILNTTSFAETANYIGLTVDDEKARILLEQFDSYYIIPAVVMTCVSSRVVLVWILNIFGSGFALSLSRVLAKSRNNSAKEVLVSRPNIRGNPVQHNEMQQRSAQNIEDMLQNDRHKPRPTPLVIPPTNANTINSPAPIDADQMELMERANAAPITNLPQNSGQTVSAGAGAGVDAGIDGGAGAGAGTGVGAAVGAGVVVAAATAAASAPERSRDSPVEPRPLSTQFSMLSPLNNRYSTYDAPFTPSPGGNIPPSRVSAELRSQLPWSYTSAGTKPVPPPKPQPKVYPNIPEPDYATSPTRNDQNTEHMYSRW